MVLLLRIQSVHPLTILRWSAHARFTEGLRHFFLGIRLVKDLKVLMSSIGGDDDQKKVQRK